jgi:hypothetical protein
VRADCGRMKGDGGGIVTVSTLAGGADLGGSCFAGSHLQQLLLPVEEAGEAGEFLSAG